MERMLNLGRPHDVAELQPRAALRRDLADGARDEQHADTAQAAESCRPDERRPCAWLAESR
jgi:hypothetical protein